MSPWFPRFGGVGSRGGFVTGTEGHFAAHFPAHQWDFLFFHSSGSGPWTSFTVAPHRAPLRTESEGRTLHARNAVRPNFFGQAGLVAESAHSEQLSRWLPAKRHCHGPAPAAAGPDVPANVTQANLADQRCAVGVRQLASRVSTTERWFRQTTTFDYRLRKTFCAPALAGPALQALDGGCEQCGSGAAHCRVRDQPIVPTAG